MNEAQYATAKDIVLDLLGWGVPPEYLVDCGLSREIVYYVFIELNLRLPNNLDLSGLPQLDPVFSGSPEPITPPPTLSPRQRSNSSVARLTASSRSVQGHPSLPRKPSAPQGTDDSGSQPHPLSATATPFVPTASTSAVPMAAPGSPPSLIDIEQQRRQELLARKAVLASRKAKQAAGTNANVPARRPTVSETEIKDVEMAPPTIPTETVEDFLSSIPAVGVDASPPSYGDDMDVDAIPGLSMDGNPISRSDSSSQQPAPPTPSSDTANPISVVFPPVPGNGTSGQSTRHPSTERSVERSMSADDKSDSSGNHTRMNSSGRRSAKRPVAADFVDMEPGPSRYKPDAVISSFTYGVYSSRKRPQSFAGLSGTRRMVINLSDSEDDGEDSINGHGNSPRKILNRRPPSRLGAAASLPQFGSPALLMEKEEEIKRMKELIAARERARLGKITAVRLTLILHVLLVLISFFYRVPKYLLLRLRQEEILPFLQHRLSKRRTIPLLLRR